MFKKRASKAMAMAPPAAEPALVATIAAAEEQQQSASSPTTSSSRNISVSFICIMSKYVYLSSRWGL